MASANNQNEAISLPEPLRNFPLIAILRGLEPATALPVIEALLTAGFRTIEIPLNSPQPFDSLKAAVDAFGADALLGAGTVLTAENAERTLESGGRLIVAPNVNPEVAAVATAANAVYCPGAMTPTEAFTAIELGASVVKIFPAEIVRPVGLKAMKAVLPPAVPVFPVGGITPENLGEYIRAGADGFGLGSAIFRPGMSPVAVGAAARAFAEAWREARGQSQD